MASQNLAAIAPDEYDLSRELTQQLLAKARLKRFAKGESLFHQGSAPDAVYFVKSGAVQLSNTSSTGREAVLGRAGVSRVANDSSILSIIVGTDKPFELCLS
jgi:CRP/FNR family cyclic AMP-dependent transcriptional regulator